MEIDARALIAVLSGEATEEERVLVERWRAASPANESEYRRRARMWELLGSLKTRADLGSAGLEGPEPAPPTPPSSIPARSWSGRSRRARSLAGAALVATVVVAAVAVYRSGSGSPGYEPLAASDVVTGPGEVRTVQLRDGTVVRLGPDSRLGVTDVVGPRDVYVEGQAYFVVPGGQPEPFRVHSSQGQVAVVGTRFEVAARGERIQVLVVEGEVELEANNERVSLRKGQAGTAAEASAPIVAPVADIYGMMAWIGTFAAYEETPLVEIAAEFQHRFGFLMEIADSALAGRTVSGMMRDQSVEDMAANVCIAVGARCTFGHGGVRMELEEGRP